jgi:hypothetical protein
MRVLSFLSLAGLASARHSIDIGMDNSFLGSVVNLGLADDGNNGALTDAIASANAAREGSESAGMSRLVAAYNNALSQSRAHMLQLLGKSGFLANGSVFRARVISGARDEGAAAQVLTNIESKRQAAENAMIDSAIGEMNEIAKVVVGEFGRHASSFLGTSVNVDSQHFPTLASLIAGVERRRDVSESRLRGEILNLELKLVNALVGSGASFLRKAFLAKPVLSVGMSSFLKDDDTVLINVKDGSFLQRQPSLSDLDIVAQANEDAARESLSAAQSVSFAQTLPSRKTQAPMVWMRYNGA